MSLVQFAFTRPHFILTSSLDFSTVGDGIEGKETVLNRFSLSASLMILLDYLFQQKIGDIKK